MTAIQSGQFSQRLEDAIFSLCAVIAARQGDVELAGKWLKKVKKTDALNTELRDILD